MSGCLACKACSTQCPIKIVCRSFALVFCSSITPVIYARARPPRRYGRELRAADGTRAETFNFFINQPLVRKLSEKHIAWLICRCCRSPRYNNKWWGILGKHDAGTA